MLPITALLAILRILVLLKILPIFAILAIYLFFLSKGANIGGGKQWRRSLELWALHLEVKIFLDLNLNIS